jgi:nitrogen fixation protein FixH
MIFFFFFLIAFNDNPTGSAFQDNSGRNIVNVYRPQSQSGSSFADSEKKRASGWFKRLRTGDNQSRRRSSLLSLEQQPHISTTTTTTAKPISDNKPPPKIPKLVHLESDNDGFGSNLFDDIK